MCKILGIINIQKEKTADAIQMAINATDALTERNRDGFGTAFLGENGLFAEKWLLIDKAWKERPVNEKEAKQAYGDMYEMLQMKNFYECEGTPSKTYQAIIAHARFATCKVNLENTHPFTHENLALIHNGVVKTEEKFDTKSTCDSELILQSYVKNNVREQPENIKKVGEEITGSMACIVIGPGYVDVWKSSTAKLVFTKLPGIGYVFATDEDVIRGSVKKARDKKYPVLEVKPDVMGRFTLTDKPEPIVQLFPFTSYSYSRTGYAEFERQARWSGEWETKNPVKQPFYCAKNIRCRKDYNHTGECGHPESEAKQCDIKPWCKLNNWHTGSCDGKPRKENKTEVQFCTESENCKMSPNHSGQCIPFEGSGLIVKVN